MKIFTNFVIILSLYLSVFSGVTNGQGDTVLLPNIIPNNYAMTPGTAGFLGPTANAARTYQMLIHQDQLTGMVNQYVTSLTFRIPTSATEDWPVSDVTFNSYDIYLGTSVPPSQRSLTFALNWAGTPTQVRSGSLVIPAGSFRFGGSPTQFGYAITFNTPYLYTGGHLLVELRHTGFTGTSRNNDAIGTAIPGYLDQFSACWTGSYTGTAGSQGNFVVLKLNSVMTNIENDPVTPVSFDLKQNYPNPFNPFTQISFSIPKSDLVTLKIYDKLGREIQTLVNEFKTAGNYSVGFMGDNLSSGTYYYRIQSGDFVSTKKMILIK
ncbi:MAG TPA: T9SS type A sorting domain-containing protein [Ignavibacteria bacterium]|nr:T9SS type A sorting domain-containing protein [Ignavibacteria bacterium]